MNEHSALFGTYDLRRQDGSVDARFYELPRLLIQGDESASRALAEFFRERLLPEGDILDLMFAYRSHLPEELSLIFGYRPWHEQRGTL